MKKSEKTPNLILQAQRREISPEEFLKNLWALSKGHSREAKKLPANRGQRIARSRVFTEPLRPLDISELSYPPQDTAPLGRANATCEPMFYASAGLPTTLVESNVHSGQYLIVTEWEVVSELILAPVGYLNFESNFNELESIYHHIFTHPGNEFYQYSSQVVKHLIGTGIIAGIIYPSIVVSNASENLAIKPSVVDSSLKLINATLYAIDNVTKEHEFQVRELDFATPLKNGLLEWKGRKGHWVISGKEQLQFISNGWKWDAYKPDGTHVDPE